MPEQPLDHVYTTLDEADSAASYNEAKYLLTQHTYAVLGDGPELTDEELWAAGNRIYDEAHDTPDCPAGCPCVSLPPGSTFDVYDDSDDDATAVASGQIVLCTTGGMVYICRPVVAAPDP